MMMLGMGMAMGLQMAQRCSVCRRLIDPGPDEGRVEIVLCGAASLFYTCPCCKRSVRQLSKAYLRRCAAFVAEEG